MISSEPPSGPERAYLDAFRDATAMPDAVRDRIARSLAGGGPLGPGGGAAANDLPGLAPTSAAGGSRWLSRSSVVMASLAVVSGALVLSLGGGGPPVEAAAAEIAPVVANSGDQRERELPTPAATSPTPAPTPIPVEAPEPEPAPTQTATAKPKPSAKVETSAPLDRPRTSSLAEERRLIEQAHAALAKGQSEAALAVLDRHAREFSSGVFVEEREALRVIAACSAGESAGSTAAAQRFLASYPHAVLAARVRSSCAIGG